MWIQQPPVNPLEVLLEEVSLEGLDGITLDALWLRLEQRPSFDLKPFDQHWKCFLFKLLKEDLNISAFELSEERGTLSIFDFKEHIDPSTCLYIEPDKDERPPDIYPYAAVHDEVRGIMGSCSTYNTRKDITKTIRNMSYDEVCEKYRNKLVFVASQQLRKKYLSITRGQYIPTNFDLTLQAYCILERIGRCRQYGCIDISKESVKMAPKDIYYHRKVLICHKLITRQSISKQKKKGIMRQNLFYLSRLHVEHKSKVNQFMETILQTLKSAKSTNYILPIKSFNDIFGFVSVLSVKKLVQYFNLENKIKEFELPFSQAYPNLPRNQWYNANKKEKQATCYQLLDPKINIEKELNRDLDSVEDEGSEEEDEMEQSDDEEREQEMMETQSQQSWLSLVEAITYIDPVSDLSDSESVISCEDRRFSYTSDEEYIEERVDVSFLKKKGFKIENETPVDISMIKQLMKVVEEAGPEGCSALHVQKKLHLLRSDIRSLVKYNAKYLHTYMKDEGRQRTQYYRLKQHEHEPQMMILKCETDAPPCKKIKTEPLFQEAKYDVTGSGKNISFSGDRIETMDSLTVTEITEKHHPQEKPLSSFFLTNLQLDRAKDVIKFVNEKRVVVGYRPVFHELIEKDQNRKIPAKLDRKTAQRMLDKLVNEGYIKLVSATFKIKDVKLTDKTVQMYVPCDLDCDCEEINNLIQREKLKFSSVDHLSVSHIAEQEIKIETKIENTMYQVENQDTKSESLFLGNENQCKSESSDMQTMNEEEDAGQNKELIKTKDFENSNTTVEINILRPCEKVVTDVNSLYPTSLMAFRAVECFNFVQQKRITVGFREVMNFVLKGDEKRHYKAKVDHRTIKRLLVKLYLHKFIKCFQLNFKNTTSNTNKEVLVYTVLDITAEDPEFLSVLEKEHLSFWSEAGSQIPKVKPSTPTEYVSLPKFAKMEKMHMLAFHVTYSSAKPLPDQDVARKNLELNTSVKLPADHPPIYDDQQLTDLTFLPSLPTPYPFPEGFISFSDFIPLIPIRTLLECLRITIFVKDFDHYYHDPVKRFYPIKDTSSEVFTILTRQNEGRKNVANVYSIFLNLATIGLTQFGKRFGIEKENFVMYMNRKASLRDTITADPSYFQLNPDQLKPPVLYDFHDLTNVRKYWLDSCHICTNTPLGSRTFAIGQKVRSYKKMSDKPSVSLICEHCDDVNTILARDNGDIPGDNLGAAGYDSGAFAHLKRNWSSRSKILKKTTVVKLHRGITKPCRLFRAGASKQEKKTVYVDRIVKPRKNTSVPKPKIIEKSSISLASMRRLRTQVKWTDADSDVLHLVKIIYKLFKVKPCNRLTRDILVKLLNKKTDGGLTAKILFSHYRRIMKMPQNKERYALLQAEVNHRKEVRNILLPHIKHHWLMCRHKEKMEAHLYLINNMFGIVSSVYDLTVVNQKSFQTNNFPESYDQFLSEYQTVGSTETLYDLYPPLSNNNNIKIHVLLNLIHSSLATITPEEDNQMRHCLFDAYQRYPQSLIHKASRILKDYQTIASTKCLMNSLQKSAKATSTKRAPLAITRFKLNIKYIYKLSITEMQYSSFHGSYVLFKQLCQSKDPVHPIENVESAYFNLLTSLLCEEKVTLDIETPKTLLLLDPKIENLNEDYKAIVDRYYQLVDHYKVGTLEKISDRNEEGEEEEDEQESIPPMNLFNAARLAMYTLKDVLIKEKISVQHIQRLLILNTCKIQLGNLNSVQSQYEQCPGQEYINQLNEGLIVPALTQELMKTVISSKLEKQLSEFIDTKLELGATKDDIRIQFGATMEVKASLEALVHKHIVIKTGNVIPIYVHNNHCSPWLVKTCPNPGSCATIETQITPWVHVNSTMNRAVLDYFLGVLLSYIMFSPGITLLSLQEHYASVLQPMNIISLVDVLDHIQCISMQAVTVVKPTLFRKGSVSVSPATGLEPSECIHIEALPNAALKLGFFMGDISYEKNYLEHLTRNDPDINTHNLKNLDSQQVD